MNKLCHYKEHERFCLNENDPFSTLLIQKLKGNRAHAAGRLKDQALLGMSYDLSEDSFYMSYYIGVDWIDKDKGISLMVTPKIEGIDFMSMLMKCFENSEINDDFDRLLHVRTGTKPIEIPSDSFQLEPVLIVYFINLVASIVRSGLKKDYIFEEQTLNGKIKGKISLSSYLSKRYAIGRKDLVDCRYQEYSEDCLENRILKAALICCKDMFTRNAKAMGHKVVGKISQLMAYSFNALQHVSADVTLTDLQRVHVNPTFKNYKTAIPIAKMIITKKGYCVNKDVSSTKQVVPPFIIDMSLLFERYLYGLLKDRYNEQIAFQVRESGNILDFCKYDEKLIIDSKYIPKWKDSINKENVRQLSGYARSVKVRKELGLSDNDEKTILPCLIVYPDISGVEDLSKFEDCLINDAHVTNVEEYIQFRKLGIKLPILQRQGNIA